jgi:murein DD-endopeptidase MepM/ murein hydrolase activator NlpD
MKVKIISTISLILASIVFLSALSLAGVFDDTTPPLIICDTPQDGEVIKGNYIFSFGVGDSKSKIQDVIVNIDGIEYPISPPEEGFENYHRFSVSIDTEGLYDGEHRLKIISRNNNDVQSVAEFSREFIVDNIPFTVSSEIDRTELKQGEIFSVVLLPSEPSIIESAKFDGRDIHFFPFGRGYKALINVRASSSTGTKKFEYIMRNVFDELIEEVIDIKVLSAKFLSEYIQLPPEKSKPFPEERRQREYQKLVNELENISDEQLWEGLFEVPVEGRLTSYFGTYRKYSTGGSSQHLGVDLACDEGTPIYSPNNGIVRIAEEFCVRGNFIMIDHGMGVYTLFNHLFEIEVESGDLVEKGDIVGYVGSTGLSTGPHLHWEMRLGRWVVNPFQWTEEVFTFKYD